MLQPDRVVLPRKNVWRPSKLCLVQAQTGVDGIVFVWRVKIVQTFKLRVFVMETMLFLYLEVLLLLRHAFGQAWYVEISPVQTPHLPIIPINFVMLS